MNNNRLKYKSSMTSWELIYNQYEICSGEFGNFKVAYLTCTVGLFDFYNDNVTVFYVPITVFRIYQKQKLHL